MYSVCSLCILFLDFRAVMSVMQLEPRRRAATPGPGESVSDMGACGVRGRRGGVCSCNVELCSSIIL